MQKFLIRSLFLVLLLSAAASWALPSCPGTYNPRTWNNCQGTYTFADQQLVRPLLPVTL